MDQALTLLEWVVLPLAMLLAATFILARFIGKAMDLLFKSYQDRIENISAERDHFKARMELHDDEIRRLASELIEALRHSEAYRRGRRDDG